jgi:hypothetical protein
MNMLQLCRLPLCCSSLLPTSLLTRRRTVWETLEFAWLVSSNGHHSYGVAADEASAQLLDREDPIRAKVLPCVCVRSRVTTDVLWFLALSVGSQCSPSPWTR